MEFSGADSGPITLVARLAQFRQIATLRGFVCRRGANASTRHKLTSIVDHLPRAVLTEATSSLHSIAARTGLSVASLDVESDGNAFCRISFSPARNLARNRKNLNVLRSARCVGFYRCCFS